MLRIKNVVRLLPVVLLLWVSACIVVVPRDETLSSRLRDWKILAERGNAEAQYNFGWYLLQSATSAEDEKLALSWFEKASQHGVAEAQFALATMLEQGKGIGAARGIATPQGVATQGVVTQGVATPQRAQARYWYRQAADAGLAAAQYNLGTIYAQGEGVLLDDEQAFQWFFLAAVQEYLPARKALRAVVKRMSAEARVRGRALVKDFLKEFPDTQQEREGKVYQPPSLSPSPS